MRLHFAAIWMLLASGLGVSMGQPPAGGEFPPRPRPVEPEGCLKFSVPEFNRLMAQLKAERDSLEAAWKSMPKSDAPVARSTDQEQIQLQKQLKLVLERLQSRPKGTATAPTTLPPLPELEPTPKNPAAANPSETKKSDSVVQAPTATKTPEPVDSLTLGHSLFRAEMYGDALTAFRSVDLKGKKAVERAPIQYLMACCLQRLGKTDESLPLLRDVANSRGDERLADYAQWHLELTRWQRETRDQLQTIRQRRQALEKK